MIVTLKDITTKITKGTTPTSIGCKFEKSGINFIKSESLVDGKTIDKSKFAFISERTHERLKRSQIEENDILFSMAGMFLGKTGIATAEVVPANTNQAVAIIRVDDTKANYEYVYYYLNQKSVIHTINTTSAQSAQPNINLKQIGEIKINLPDRKKQDQIVSLLSAIDLKISNNVEINDNLEQQAQAIFKEWFIENPENNEWSTGTFSELIKTTLNGDWGKEAPTGNNTEKVYCIRGADIPEVKAGNKGKMPTRYILPKNFVKKQLTAGDIVVEISGGSPTQSTGRCTAITQSLLDRYDSGMVCTNFCKAIKPKEGYSLFIYYYWQYLYGKGIFFSYENGTTGIKNLDFSGFIETETILIPPVDKVIAFDDYCKSIFNQIFANGKQNEHLAVLRDTLLPKLMSGELDVSDIDL